MKMLAYSMLSCMLLISTSCMNQEDGQYIPGVNGPKVNIQDGKVLLTVELENVDIDAGITMPVPKLKHSTLTVGPAFDDSGVFGGTMIRVAFDPKDVEGEDFRVVPSNTLPDGRPFPFIVDGTLPAIAVQVPKAKNATFYMSEKVFGFFLPIKLPKDFDVSVHYRIKINGKNYGIVSLIQPDFRDEGAGIVVLLTLDDIRRNSDAQKLLSISKKRKNVLY